MSTTPSNHPMIFDEANYHMTSINARHVQDIVNAELAPGESMNEQALWRAFEKRHRVCVSLVEVRSALSDADQYGWVSWTNQTVKRPLL